VLQLAHPLVAHAIGQHSHTRRDVVGRFQRTFRNVFAMIYGDLDAAFTAARRVHAIHTRIHGVIPERAGRWEAGTPYHANDPDTLRWVYATLVDTTLAVREQLDGALPASIKDAYVIEMNRFAALFGIPRGLLAHDHAAHEAYMRDMLASDRLAVAPCAREMAGFLVGRGGTRQPPLGRLVEAITATMIPAHLAAGFGLRAAPARVRLGLDVFGRVYRRVPHAMRGIPARLEAQRRLEDRAPRWLAAWIERQLFALARRTTGVPIDPMAATRGAGSSSCS
jgi:uncharacterized protein (DUF2236 family)